MKHKRGILKTLKFKQFAEMVNKVRELLIFWTFFHRPEF
jgi:hypothetical protein